VLVGIRWRCFLNINSIRFLSVKRRDRQRQEKMCEIWKSIETTSAQVEEIRKMVIEWSNKTEIAQKFNVSRQTIYNVLEWYLSVYSRTEKGSGMVKIIRCLSLWQLSAAINNKSHW